MSAGQPWIDQVMFPLSEWAKEFDLTSRAYNRIYEAVGRGTPEQGRALVVEIVESLRSERRRGVEEAASAVAGVVRP